jgi:hypothetical protein
MTLLYRAVWEDHDHLPMAVLDDEFHNWCQSKGIEDVDIPRRGRIETAHAIVDVRRGDTESGRVLRAQLVERDERVGRRWTTTATAINAGNFRGYWVDVECESDRDERLPIAAPRLVRMILAEEGRPHRGPLPIAASHWGVVSNEAVMDLLDLLQDPTRDLPLVVFSPDTRAGDNQELNIEINSERAERAAETLAGLAYVSLLSPASLAQFNAAIPDGMRVYGGAVRAYLPGFGPDDDIRRHRYWSLLTIRRHARRAGDLIAQHLAQFQHLIEVPPEWAIVRPLVTRPTEEESAERRSALTAEFPNALLDVNVSNRQSDDMLRRIVELERERDQALDELQGETRTLRSRVDVLQGEHLDDAIALEDLADENRALRQNMNLLSTTNADADAERSEDIDDVHPPQQCADVVDLAMEHLGLVQIHPNAPRDVERLDASAKDRVWAQAAWQGLCALQRYAQEVSRGLDTGGFYVWCDQSGQWSTSKLAMVESETVMNSDDLSRHRMLPVDTRIASEGRILMQAHLKVQPGGGPIIPRIYFHDDTRGETGKIHIGFFGPHDLVPNTKRR